MTSTQVVETSVIVTNNNPFEEYPYPDDHTTRSTIYIIGNMIHTVHVSNTVKAPVSRHCQEADKVSVSGAGCLHGNV